MSPCCQHTRGRACTRADAKKRAGADAERTAAGAKARRTVGDAARGIRGARGKGGQVTRLLTPGEVLSVLRIERKKLYRLIQSGQLRARRVGRELRFTEEDVAQFITGARIPIVGRVARKGKTNERQALHLVRRSVR